jgi:hypothetical protein
VDETGKSLPYKLFFAEWRDYFADLRAHQYWDRLSGNRTAGDGDIDEPVSVRNEPVLAFGGDGPFVHRVASSRDRDFIASSSPVNRVQPPSLKTPPKVKKSKKKKKKGKRQRANCNRSTSFSESTSSSEDSSDSAGPSAERKNESSLIKAFANFNFPKEVVPPTVFDPANSDSLGKFLKTYERYFDAKYTGSEKEKSRQLGRFLKGSARRAFDAIGGGDVKYNSLKDGLLSWYGSERTSIRQRKQDEFRNATMLPEDTVVIYCLRLEKLAELAYPDSTKDRERNLCRKVREAAPTSFLLQMDNAQSVGNAYGDAKMTWTVVRKLAETHDRQRKLRHHRGGDSRQDDDAEVAMYFGNLTPEQAESVPRPALPQAGGTRPKQFNKAQVFRNRQDGSSRGGRFSPPKTKYAPSQECQFCGRPGHDESNCWIRNSACYTCGERGHWSARCPKRPNRCTECGGPHLGKDCPDLVPSEPHLNGNALSREGNPQSRQ